MPAEWNKLNKPTDSNWGVLPKPNNTIRTSVTTIPHSKGKFMGILGLTYPGTSDTTVSDVTSGWDNLASQQILIGELF